MAASLGRPLHSFLVLLGWLLAAPQSLGLSSGDSLNDDLLLPYSEIRMRLPRDCRTVRNGTRPHENWPLPARVLPSPGALGLFGKQARNPDVPNSTQKCQCQNGASCDPLQGTCTCLPGFQGDTCAEVCPLGWYGPNCQHACTCESSCPCDPKTGNCNLTSTMQDILSQVCECLAPSMIHKRTEEHPYFTKPAWLSLTLALALLLLLSAAANVAFVLGSRTSRRCLDGEYAYHPLQQMNGELQSLEKEQQGDASLSMDSKQ